MNYKGEVLISPCYYNKISNRIMTNITRTAYLQFPNLIKNKVFVNNNSENFELYIYCPPAQEKQEKFIIKPTNIFDSNDEMRIIVYTKLDKVDAD